MQEEVHGAAACRNKPTLLTTHAGWAGGLNKSRALLWPRQLSEAPVSVVTILREPAERVWSFYWYLRRWYTPFQKQPLEYFLRRPLLDVDVAFNLTGKGERKFCSDSGAQYKDSMCPHQLFNGMTGYFSTTPGSLVQLHVDEALTALASLQLIGTTEHLDAFTSRLRLLWSPAVFRDSLPSSGRSTSDCKVVPENARPHPKLADATEDVRALIESSNALDVQLYRRAQELPRFVKSPG